MITDFSETGTLLRMWNVTYVSGLLSVPKLRREIAMQLFEKGFCFTGSFFPDLWIFHNSIIDFKLATGWGDFWKKSIYDHGREKMIEITFFNATNEKTTLRLEMATNASPLASAFDEYHACKELVCLMRSNGIFFRNSPSQPTTSASLSTLAQIAQLSELHKSGVLTDEEFETKKAELLKRI